MRKVILCVACLLVSLCGTGAPVDTTGYLSFRDTVFLQVEAGEKIYVHTIKRGQTLFSLARFYGLHYQELQFLNPGLGEQVSVGHEVRIPIPNRSILRFLPTGASRAQFAPVAYRVKKGDTVFRIGQYFKLSTEEISKRGGIKGDALKPGMVVPVGWISVSGVREEDRTAPTHPMLKRNLPYRQRFEALASAGKVQKIQGPAYWQKGGSEEGTSFFVRFNEAPPQSVIEITNPMNQSKIFAEVLGPIPPTIYDPQVVAVLSPAAAKMLGAHDPQFFVKIRYIK